MVKKFYQKIVGFLKDVRAELSKVTFPNKQETMGSTTVVIIFTLIVSVFLFIVDSLLVRLLGLVV